MSKAKGAPATRDPAPVLAHIMFQVEDNLYQVPTEGLFVPGSFFETHFNLPADAVAEGGDPIEGTVDNPLFLDGITIDDFRLFLRLLYPVNYQPAPVEPPTPESMFKILDLATKWGIRVVRTQLITLLESHVNDSTDIDRVAWGYKYCVRAWFFDGLLAMSQGGREFLIPYSSLRYRGLDTETILKLFSLREYYLLSIARGVHLKDSIGSAHVHVCGHCKRKTSLKGTLMEVMKARLALDFGGELSQLHPKYSYCRKCCPPRPD